MPDPSITDWLTAAGTILAAGGTIIAATFGVRAYINDQERRAEEADDKRRSQARKVWLERLVVRTTTAEEEGGRVFRFQVPVLLHNDSDELARILIVYVDPWYYETDPKAHILNVAKTLERLGPHSEEKIDLYFDVPFQDGNPQMGDAGQWSLQYKLSFYDSADRQWWRDNSDKLTPGFWTGPPLPWWRRINRRRRR